jgi:hypothetical protein
VSATRPPAYDERYTAPVEASRRGAHRARPNPLTSVIPVLAGMAVVVLVVVGAFTLLGDRGGSGDDSGPPAAGAQPSTQPSASTSATPSNGASAPAGSPSADPSASAGGEVDKTIELRVLNSVSTSGLARKYATQLEADEWTVGETADSEQRNLETTRVYYAKTSQKPSADAIVALLGFGEVKKSAANAGDGITVVLGEDAPTS